MGSVPEVDNEILIANSKIGKDILNFLVGRFCLVDILAHENFRTLKARSKYKNLLPGIGRIYLIYRFGAIGC